MEPLNEAGADRLSFNKLSEGLDWMSAFFMDDSKKRQKSAFRLKERAAQLAAGLDAFLGKPALVHFQNVAHRLA